MKRTSFDGMECPIACAIEEIGEGWTLLVLRDLLLGARLFGDFERRLGIPASTLTRRLATLEASGLVERRRYEAHPPRDEYSPTPKARELFPLFVALGDWSNRWLAGAGREHIVFVDAKSGERVVTDVMDRRAKRRVEEGSVRLAPGPRASKTLAKELSPHRQATRARG